MNDSKPSVLFVCTGNAGRSQMAQAMFRELVGEAIHIESAGVDPWSRLHPMMVRLMRKRGVSLDGHYPKPVSSVADQPFDFVVTIGDPARALLPKSAFSAAYWMHWDIGDPADADGTPDSGTVFRSTASRIERRLPELRARIERLGRPSVYAGGPGIGTGLWAAERFVPSDHLPLVKEAGFRAIELNLYAGRDHFDGEDPSAMRTLREVADDLGLLIWSVHSPDLGSIAAHDAGERVRQADVLRRCLDVAEQLGAKVVVSHALLFGPFEEDPEVCEERIAAFLADFTDETEPHPAQIAFENGELDPPATWAVNILRRLDDASRPAYGFVLDTGHANLAGDLADIAAHLRDHLISLHLNDNDGRGDQHLMPGEGSLDWAAVHRVLRTSGYRGVLMYEIAGRGPDRAEQLNAVMRAHRKYVANVDV